MRQLFKKVSAFAFAFGALLAALPLSAQVGTNYTFSQTTGTYTPITGGTVLVSQTTTTASNAGSLDDGTVYTLPGGTIPFTFTYDGVGYTGLTVGNNGSISFGATPMTANTYGALSTTTAYAGAVAAYSRDLQGGYVFSANRTLASTVLTMGTGGSTAGVTVGSTISGTGSAVGATVVSFDATSVTMSLPATSTGTNTAAWVWNGEIRYETVGVSPNQEFVIQWSNMKPFGTTLTTVNGFRMNMQVRLKEIDNSVEIHYGDCTPGAATSTTTAQVGLRGPNNTFATNVNNRLVTSGANDWAALPGATNASACRLSATAPANVPASGTVYRWFDPPCAAPIANVTTGAPNCATNQYTATVNLTSLGDAPNVDIISSVNGLIADDVVALAAYPSAPVALGTPESFTVVHNGNALCNISLGPVNVLDGDNTCHAATVYPVSNTLPTRDVTFCMTDPGTSLGVDVFVQSVELVIAHTWNDDMDIQLINPNGTIVNLVNDRFGSGDNLGVIAGCATKFVLPGRWWR
ncbi:MAG: hypothetical protein IPO17_05625 [Flavobacteriales bacterium]|nr:hypothetical protein [Flavobacteriales bacterium]